MSKDVESILNKIWDDTTNTILVYRTEPLPLLKVIEFICIKDLFTTVGFSYDQLSEEEAISIGGFTEPWEYYRYLLSVGCLLTYGVIPYYALENIFFLGDSWEINSVADSILYASCISASASLLKSIEIEYE